MDLPGLSNFVNWVLLVVCLAAFVFLFVSCLRLRSVAIDQNREHDPLEMPMFPSMVTGTFVMVVAIVLLYVPATDALLLFIGLVLAFAVLAFFAGTANVQRRRLWLEEGPEEY